jgi:hypothetical protein
VLHPSYYVRRVAFSPDGRSVICGLQSPPRRYTIDCVPDDNPDFVDYTAMEIINVETGEKEDKLRLYSEYWIHTFSADMRRVMTESEGGTYQQLEGGLTYREKDNRYQVIDI